ncbi:MAG: hypothetical protein IME94_05525 [Proteobacteria bacterium]|nr:hypothetical protein [Pseudomonadota bacterium]
MPAPEKRSEKLTRPLINIFVGHYQTQFGVHPTKQFVDRVIKSIIKKKQEEFIESTFSGQNWNAVDLVDVAEAVNTRVIDLKELEINKPTILKD